MSEAIANPAPLEEGEILNPEWLTAALDSVRPGTKVRGFEVIQKLTHTWYKYRLKLDYDAAPAGLTDSVCIKAFTNPTLKGMVSMNSAMEARFYRECAPKLPLRAPVCIYSGIDEGTGHGLIMMEDLIVQGAKFGSALTPYTIDEVRSSLKQLAVLHVEARKNWTPETLPWAKPFLEKVSASPIIPVELLHELLNGERGDPLPVELRDGQRLQNAIAALRDRFKQRTPTLVHGDAHAGNLYVHEGETGIIDWQVLQWGCWALDVAYHIGAVLTPEVRREQERDLLASYLDSLQSLGGPKIAFDDAFEDYRAALAYGFYLWGVTRRVETPIMLEFNRRLGTAVADHQSYAVLGV